MPHAPKHQRRTRRPHYASPFCMLPGVECSHVNCAANPTSEEHKRVAQRNETKDT